MVETRSLISSVQTILENSLKSTENFGSNELLELPKHWQVTLLALEKLGGKGDAEQVAAELKRARASASGVLNALKVKGFVTAERVGRRKVFTIKTRKLVSNDSREA